MLKKFAYVLAALLVGVVAVDLIRGNLGGSEEDGQAAYDRLAGMGAKLREAGTAQVTFRADLRTDVGTLPITWAGTSQIRFGDTTASDTTYSAVTIGKEQPFPIRRLYDGDEAYYRSPNFVPDDRRPWVRARTMYWETGLADPELGLTDYPMWQEFLNNVQRDNAAAAVTDELTDIAGAEREYRLTCTPGDDAGCPPPFRTPLDQFFNQVPDITWSIWLDGDGRPRRVDVANTLWWDPDLAPAEPGVPHRPEAYEYRATFEFTGFGAPVTVTAPPANEVSEQRVVSWQK